MKCWHSCRGYIGTDAEVPSAEFLSLSLTPSPITRFGGILEKYFWRLYRASEMIYMHVSMCMHQYGYTEDNIDNAGQTLEQRKGFSPLRILTNLSPCTLLRDMVGITEGTNLEAWSCKKKYTGFWGAEDPVPRAVVKIGKGKTSICHLCSEDFVDTTLHLHMGSWGWNNRVEEASKRLPLVSVEGVPNYDHSLPS